MLTDSAVLCTKYVRERQTTSSAGTRDVLDCKQRVDRFQPSAANPPRAREHDLLGNGPDRCGGRDSSETRQDLRFDFARSHPLDRIVDLDSALFHFSKEQIGPHIALLQDPPRLQIAPDASICTTIDAGNAVVRIIALMSVLGS
jgi:hypothetical protein